MTAAEDEDVEAAMNSRIATDVGCSSPVFGSKRVHSPVQCAHIHTHAHAVSVKRDNLHHSLSYAPQPFDPRAYPRTMLLARADWAHMLCARKHVPALTLLKAPRPMCRVACNILSEMSWSTRNEVGMGAVSKVAEGGTSKGSVNGVTEARRASEGAPKGSLEGNEEDSVASEVEDDDAVNEDDEAADEDDEKANRFMSMRISLDLSCEPRCAASMWASACVTLNCAVCS